MSKFGDPLVEYQKTKIHTNINQLRKHPEALLTNNNTDGLQYLNVFTDLMEGSDVHTKITDALRGDDYTNIKSGTAGEFLYGCVHKQKDVNNLCVPSCIRGFRYSIKDRCDVQSYEYMDGKFVGVNQMPGTTIAYLFTDTRDIPEEIKHEVAVDGVEKLSVYLKQGDTIDYEHIMEFDLLPMRPLKDATPPKKKTPHASIGDPWTESDPKSRGTANKPSFTPSFATPAQSFATAQSSPPSLTTAHSFAPIPSTVKNGHIPSPSSPSQSPSPTQSPQSSGPPTRTKPKVDEEEKDTEGEAEFTPSGRPCDVSSGIKAHKKAEDQSTEGGGRSWAWIIIIIVVILVILAICCLLYKYQSFQSGGDNNSGWGRTV